MSDVLTEEEAKSKWCPLVRVMQRPIQETPAKSVHPVVSVNRMPYVNDDMSHLRLKEHCCIGSDCMAWHTVFSASPTDKPKGFCGAFGRPAGA